jgi:cephalosporin hydroxylase
MEKKIYNYNDYLKKINRWVLDIGKNKKVKNLSKKLYIEADKNNYSYLYSWNNEPLLQNSEDLITLQEIISNTKPEIVVELGVAWGGSILFLDSLSKTFPIKKIIGIDIFIPNDLKKRLQKKISKKVILIDDDTCSNKVRKLFLRLKKKYKKFLIHLDSNHTHEHVLKELNFYSKLLSLGDYIIVGDTIIDYIPKQKHRIREWGKGNSPKSALDEFLRYKDNSKKFIIDNNITNKQLLTNNPYGYIKRIK